MAEILFIQAGGTIDKDYSASNENHGYNFTIDRAAWHSIMDRVKIPYAVGFTSACRKDSLDMNDKDRNHIKRVVQTAKEGQIIIMHGTDTIHITAQHLSDIKDKTIVLTGAMVPEKFRYSDADFNVGMAVGAIPHLSPGVYIALYGEVLRHDEYAAR